MPIQKGQCLKDPVTGLSGRIFNKMKSRGHRVMSFVPDVWTEGSVGRANLAAWLETIAEAVCEELCENAEAYDPAPQGNPHSSSNKNLKVR